GASCDSPYRIHMLIENVLLRQLRGSLSATTRNHRWKITTVGCEIVQAEARLDFGALNQLVDVAR
ncbi:MAG TPA: hypothetical protein VH933_15440, partial [Aestuariivirgaceae bacterium]